MLLPSSSVSSSIRGFLASCLSCLYGMSTTGATRSFIDHHLIRDDVLLQARVPGARRLDTELDLTTTVQEPKQEVRFIDCMPDRDQSMIQQHPRNRVRVADGVHIPGPGLVDLGVDVEPGRVGGPRAVAADHGALVDVKAEHVTGIEQGEVPPDGIHPDEVGELGVAHADGAMILFVRRTGSVVET